MHELEVLSSLELRQLIEDGATTAIVPFGSIEEHGGHLPLSADALLADVVGREVAARLDAVLAPTERVGCAEQHMPGVGTLTLAPVTLSDVAFEIGRSLAIHGFRVIALVSTHGGNRVALDDATKRLNQQLRRAVACAPEGDVGRDPGTRSGEWLTSVMLALRPDLVDLDAADRDLAAELRAANPERGAIHVERFVASIVDAAREAASRLVVNRD
jgi:creatinine amidohydrolase